VRLAPPYKIVYKSDQRVKECCAFRSDKKSEGNAMSLCVRVAEEYDNSRIGMTACGRAELNQVAQHLAE
jgi:hypothetical protein